MRIITLVCASLLIGLTAQADDLSDKIAIDETFSSSVESTDIEPPSSPSETDKSVCSDEAFVHSAWSLQEALTPAQKRWKRDDIVTVPKFGGFVVGSYKYDDAEGQHNGDGFNIRYVRLYVDGTVFRDFKYRVQMELNGTPHLKDATLEWVHWKWFQVKAGQFKRAFTFENPMNPWDLGFGDYSQMTKKFAGMGDRCGEASMGGRDIGVQLQGDVAPSKRDGHAQFHYQVAVYNGQGINAKDQNKQKDWIGTVQWSPVKGLSLGFFGWNGSWYSSEKKINLDRRRYAFGVKYLNAETGWSARAEYARSKGRKASDWVQDAETGEWGWSAKSLAKNGGDHSDGWYAMLGVPVWRWITASVKYDAYREYATNSSMHTIYSASVDLQPHKNLKLQLQYNYNDDKTVTAPERHYNQFWAMMYVRF